MTVKFLISSYAMDGLSSDKLRMLLHPMDEEFLDDDASDDDGEDGDDESDGGGGDDKASINSKFDFRDNVVLATLQDGTRGKWMETQVMYSYAKPHKVSSHLLSKKIGDDI